MKPTDEQLILKNLRSFQWARVLPSLHIESYPENVYSVNIKFEMSARHQSNHKVIIEIHRYKYTGMVYLHHADYHFKILILSIQNAILLNLFGSSWNDLSLRPVSMFVIAQWDFD